MSIKIFLMYYDRFETATTSQALKKEKHIILCHNNKERFKNIHGELIETKEKKGIQNNFNFALNTLKRNEWAIFMSDDYKKSFKLNKQKTDFIRCELSEVLNNLKETIKIADKINVKLVGLNSTGNAMYSKKKYGKFGLVDGRFFAIKKTDFLFDERINCATDYYATLFHLKRYKGNLISNHYYSTFERYTKNGIGTLEQRAEQKKKDVFILKNLFPNNVKIIDKKGQPKGTHIKITR